MKVIIIGGIAAGTSAGAKLKRISPDTEVVIYEKSDIVSFGACGLPYFVANYFEEPNKMIARTPEAFEKSGVKVKTKHEIIDVNFHDKFVIVKDLSNGKDFKEHYDKLMIATGASSIIPPIKNVNISNVCTLKSMEDGIRLKELMKDPRNKKVVIVGAGFIGLEAVESAKEHGKEVAVVQLEDRILKDVFDKEITDLLEEELRNNGIDLYLNETVNEIVGEEKVTKIRTNEREIDADIVVIATGVRPNTEVF